MTRTLDQTVLLNAIIANPDDDALRLVYADCLQENGDDARAEFVRVQVELAKFGPPHKQPHWPDQPTSLKAHGDKHYSFCGYTDEGFQVGDRIDLLVHRPLRKPKMVHGFRVYKLTPRPEAYASRELDVYVHLDEQSGPWLGDELRDRTFALLHAHEADWRRGPACEKCGGAGWQGPLPDGMVNYHCSPCDATGDAGGLMKGGIGQFPWHHKVEFGRGFPHRVHCTLAEGVAEASMRNGMGALITGTASTVPSPWLRRVLTATPERALVREVVPTDREPMTLSKPAVDGKPFVWHKHYYWRDVPHFVPVPIWDLMEGEIGPPELKYYAIRAAAFAALSRAVATWGRTPGVAA